MTPKYETALHEAAHVVMHCKVGKGYADKVWIGKDVGRVEYWDLSIGACKSFHHNAVIAAAGPATEIILGRPPRLYADNDWEVVRRDIYDNPTDEVVATFVGIVQKFLQQHWDIVRWAANMIYWNLSASGVLCKRKCKEAYDDIRPRILRGSLNP